jgi:hypothetical protein
VEDPELDYECLRREAGEIGQDKAIFGRRKVLTDIFGR